MKNIEAILKDIEAFLKKNAYGEVRIAVHQGQVKAVDYVEKRRYE